MALIYPLTYGRLVPDVLKEDVEGLEELDADVTAALLVHDLQEEREHVALKEEAEKRKNHRFDIHGNAEIMRCKFLLGEKYHYFPISNWTFCRRPH